MVTLVMRSSAISVLVLCTFAGPAWAEKIGLKDEPAITILASDLAGLEFAAADSSWRQSPGADLWWLVSDDLRALVKVFSTFQHPGNGEPNCCFRMTVEGTDFWVDIKDAMTSPPRRHPRNGPTQVPDTIASTPRREARVDSRSPVGTDTSSSDAAFISDAPSGPFDFTASNAAEQPESTSSTIAQVPEPSLMWLLGVALTARAGRLKTRR